MSKEEIIKKWKKSGLLDNLTEMDKNSPMLKLMESIKEQRINEFPNIEPMNKVNEAGYNEATKFGPSENNPPKNIYTQQVDFSNLNADKITSGTTNKPLENRKTAMQELFDNLESIDITTPLGVKKIFLEKEKKQIIDAYKEGCFDNILDEKTDKARAEDYYNETFKKD